MVDVFLYTNQFEYPFSINFFVDNMERIRVTPNEATFAYKCGALKNWN